MVKLLLEQSYSHLFPITLATDKLGWTCIHHLVQPFPDGSYATNLDLLELLHEFSASLTKKDHAGLSPSQYALQNGVQHLYEKIQELTAEQKMDSMSSSVVERFDVQDPNKHLLDPPDFYSDAQQWIDQYISNHSFSIPVDPLSKMNRTGEIPIDTENNEPYDIRLTIAGSSNFYRMQIIEHRSETNLYLLFTRWGRIGEGEGQHRLTPYSSFDECRAKFCQIFQEKTGSSWEASKQSNEGQLHRSIDVPIDFAQLQDDTQHPPSQIQSSAYRTFFKTLLTSEAIPVNLKKSRLNPAVLRQAHDILNELQQQIKQRDQLKQTLEQTMDDAEKVKVQQILDSIVQLTHAYYHLIPLQGYDDEKLPILAHENLIRAQEEKLAELVEMELSYKILLAAQANQNRISPLDYLYRSINCQFEAMPPNDLDFQLILRYIWTSSPDIQVEQIFKIAREHENERLEKHNHQNHVLLWHGTNIRSLISALTRGRILVHDQQRESFDAISGLLVRPRSTTTETLSSKVIE